jgi:hypothetical protein
MTPHPSLADRFHSVVPAFVAGPAPLYAHLASSAARELERPGASAFSNALLPFDEEPPRRFLPLRLLALVHRWVLAGELPHLAPFYPSAGGTNPPEGAWGRFAAAVIGHASELPALLAPPLQHNEPGRAGALAIGMLAVARRTGMPLRLLEVGTSAGLLLRWDRYRNLWWFPELFEDSVALDDDIEIVERRGCDLHPIDPTRPENKLLLRSFVWADLPSHLRMVEDAVEVCRWVPAVIETADGAEWLEEQLARPRPGVATVVFHSLMRASGPPESLERMPATLSRAGARASAEAPLAYLRFEARDGVAVTPGQARGLVETRLTLWPGGLDRLLATSDVNGRHVRRCEEVCT